MWHNALSAQGKRESTMSQLNQAKREAKRLLRLSKQQNDQINIKTLTEASRYIAEINGYSNWHDYAENLKRKDFITGSTDVPVISKKSFDQNVLNYYLSGQEFICHMRNQPPKMPIIEKRKNSILALGECPKHGTFAKPEKLALTNFPAVITGSTGAGKSEVLRSLCFQMISNGEGAIYMDGKGDNSLYAKIHSHCVHAGRIDDFYVINLMGLDRDNVSPSRKLTHSVDPINSIIGNEQVFNNIFGIEIGTVIHTMAASFNQQGLLLDGSNLKSMLMIHNLIEWSESRLLHSNQREAIKHYLKVHLSLNVLWADLTVEDQTDVLIKHASLCSKAKISIEAIIKYESLGLFSKNPEIDMMHIFTGRKIVLVLMPALEKSPDELSVLGTMLAGVIYATSKKVHDLTNNAAGTIQNIIIDETDCCISEIMSETMAKFLPNSCRWIFAFHGYHHSRIKSTMANILAVAKTVIIMKCEDAFDIPDALIGRICRAVNNVGAIFYKDYELRKQRTGEAYVFSDNESHKGQFTDSDIAQYPSLKDGAYLKKFKAIYLNCDPVKTYKLNMHSYCNVEPIKSIPLASLVE